MSKNQDYDKIIRESVELVIPTIIEKLCGLHPRELLDLPTSFQRTRRRKLCNLQPQTIQQIEAMPINYDITTDIRYQQGIEQGMSLKTRKTVGKMLVGNRFSLREIAEIAEVSIDYVIKVQNELTEKNQKGKK